MSRHKSHVNFLNGFRDFVADVEFPGDRLVALAAREVFEDLALALGQRGQQAVAVLVFAAGLQQLGKLERHFGLP